MLAFRPVGHTKVVGTRCVPFHGASRVHLETSQPSSLPIPRQRNRSSHYPPRRLLQGSNRAIIMDSIVGIAEKPEDAVPRDVVIDWLNQLTAGEAARGSEALGTLFRAVGPLGHQTAGRSAAQKLRRGRRRAERDAQLLFRCGGGKVRGELAWSKPGTSPCGPSSASAPESGSAGLPRRTDAAARADALVRFTSQTGLRDDRGSRVLLGTRDLQEPKTE